MHQPGDSTVEDSLFSIKQGNKANPILHYKFNPKHHALQHKPETCPWKTADLPFIFYCLKMGKIWDQLEDKGELIPDQGTMFTEVSIF